MPETSDTAATVTAREGPGRYYDNGPDHAKLNLKVTVYGLSEAEQPGSESCSDSDRLGRVGVDKSATVSPRSS